jgi:N-methylhydantoinase A/oxoprolinase/acetone carboxylase beta subunit
MGLTIGINIGGTFTDVVVLGPEEGIASFTKVASTPADLSQGVLTGLQKILRIRPFCYSMRQPPISTLKTSASSTTPCNAS